MIYTIEFLLMHVEKFIDYALLFQVGNPIE
jgi:hypothetical protein